jgi:hypothetical protein
MMREILVRHHTHTDIGNMLDEIDRSCRPSLLARLLNNYWTTNFSVSQPGFLRFHYELATHSGFNAINAAWIA